MSKPAKRGGKRSGAGRKPASDQGPRVSLSASVSPEVADYLASVPNRSMAIDGAVRESSGFRAWAGYPVLTVRVSDNS